MLNTREEVNDWNRKIYKNADGTHAGPEFGAEELWEEFEIKSAPKFKSECWSHIPAKWADDVRDFLKNAQDELGEKVTFHQIKEKWCTLTVYCHCTDEDTRKRVRELELECIDKLVSKGVHPPRQENKND